VIRFPKEGPMRVRLGYALELVVVLAAGMGLARWAASSPWAKAYLNRGDLGRRVQFLVEPILAGIALAGGLGTWLEAARRRSPPTWDIGRWCWSVTALTVLLYSVAESTMQMAVLWKRQGHPDVKVAIAYAQNSVLTAFYPQTCWVLAAALITSRIASQPRVPAPDAREWAGRVFLALLVTWGVTYRLIAVIISG
jgi:hypothetical protein